MLCFYRKISFKRLLVIYRAKSNYTNIIDDIEKCLSKMPPDKKHVAKVRLAHEARKQNASKYVGSKKVRIEVIGCGAHGAPRSVNIYVDSYRYLFNCGEGTQRLASEYKIKLSSWPQIFVTYPSWENISGLLGVALSLQTMGIPELSIHGPRLIESVFIATNKFVALRSISLRMKDVLENTEFTDGVVNIQYVPIFSKSNENVHRNLSNPSLPNLGGSALSEKTHAFQSQSYCEHEDDLDYYAHLNRNKRIKLSPTVKNKRSKSASRNHKITEIDKFSVAYILRTKKTLGNLLIDKCVEYNVPCGPLLGDLKKGIDITLNDGTVVKSSDVKLPDLPGNIIIVMECPSEEFLDPLLTETAFLKHQVSDDSSEIASAVVHFSNAEIVNHPKYKIWINRFPKETLHIFINENNSSLGSVGVQRIQHKLNILHPEIFPLLPDCGIPIYPRTTQTQPEHILVPSPIYNTDKNCSGVEQEFFDKIYLNCGDYPFIKAQTLCEIYIKPKHEYNYSEQLVLKRDMFYNEVNKIPDFQKMLKKLKSELNSMVSSQHSYPKILFLGTGSSQPNKFRNTSGILIFFSENTYMLFDCGESTYNQIIQFFGKEKGKEILRNLNVIYISHLHADHHMGLITILKKRKAVLEEYNKDNPNKKYQPVSLLVPIQLTRWLNVFSQEFENITSLYNIIPNSSLTDAVFSQGKYLECLSLLNLKEIKTTLVDHCPNAFGVSLTHNDGWKLTYSGDTRPCQNLVDIGKNSDILIHEASMDDSLRKLADLKLHSTTSQAIEIGRKMNAKYVLLTHFSQRYAHIPIINESFKENTGIAFDNMIVSMNQLPILSKFHSILKLMFSEQYEVMENKIMQKAFKAKKIE